MRELKLIQINEYELSDRQRSQILSLLNDCFPGYFEERIFFKQMSQERLLAYSDGDLVGHLGLEHRAIRIGDQWASIFGIVDLCVKEEARRQGVATELLRAVEEKAAANGIHFCLLFADEHKLYQNAGYTLFQNDCVWFGIDEGHSIGLIKRKLTDCMLVKRISGDIPWDETHIVDLLGHLF
ncbi:Acetyltransferase (GNAT) family protein [Gimesia alba]|uniref:Acetyltransferase (GNAT) family protein n=1 Tax=Gimesia alba TaxID=2527973 RepID=A0A517RNG8_9PLAN|nr:GNAT family N-acetyltransferase [Gimesia alba]QDT45430.1 Acetyltransferase (GNAT) family protein [Gimesia alba]